MGGSVRKSRRRPRSGAEKVVTARFCVGALVGARFLLLPRCRPGLPGVSAAAGFFRVRDFLALAGSRVLLLDSGLQGVPACTPTPPHGCAPQHRHRLGYPIPRYGTRSHSTSRLRATASVSAWLPDSPPRHPLPHTSWAVARSGVRSHSTSRLRATALASALSPGYPLRHPLHCTSRLRATASASAWLPDTRPRLPLPHTFSAVAGLGPRYCHHLHLHLTVARHGIGIGFVTRFPATAPTSHFLGGLALWRFLPHTSSAGSRSGICCHPTSSAGSRSCV